MSWEFQHVGTQAWAMATASAWSPQVTAVSMFPNPETGLRITETVEDDSNGNVLGRFDRQSRIHSVDGQPGLEYSDGRREWFWHGVKVPQHVVCEPHLITAQEIDSELNAEVRRVMIERYPGGALALIQAQGAKMLQKDDFGELWARAWRGQENPSFLRHDQSIVMLKVKNSSPEPDGSFRDYWLRVPPTVRTAKEAVAWTFGMTEKQYQPEVET